MFGFPPILSSLGTNTVLKSPPIIDSFSSQKLHSSSKKVLSSALGPYIYKNNITLIHFNFKHFNFPRDYFYVFNKVVIRLLIYHYTNTTTTTASTTEIEIIWAICSPGCFNIFC